MSLDPLLATDRDEVSEGNKTPLSPSLLPNMLSSLRPVCTIGRLRRFELSSSPLMLRDDADSRDRAVDVELELDPVERAVSVLLLLPSFLW